MQMLPGYPHAVKPPKATASDAFDGLHSTAREALKGLPASGSAVIEMLAHWGAPT